jgi:ketosteroid isomerase-like protein
MNLPQSDIDALLTAEAERGRYLVEQHFDRLAEMLTADYIHTHTRGNAEDKATYLHTMSQVLQTMGTRREGLRLVPLGPGVVLMHGRQINQMSRRGHEGQMNVESTVTQVWVRQNNGPWQLAAFQASPLGAPPPQR